jgi:hypothetical protein
MPPGSRRRHAPVTSRLTHSNSGRLGGFAGDASRPLRVMQFGGSSPTSRSDGLKVAVGLQPTGSGTRRLGRAALATPETAQLPFPTRLEPDESSSVANAVQRGPDGARPWTEAARLPSFHRYAMIARGSQTAAGLTRTLSTSKGEREWERGPISFSRPTPIQALGSGVLHR